MYNLNKRRLLSALCHGSIFLTYTLVAIGIPIVVLFISDDPVVKWNAKEVLNFHFNMWFYGIVFGLLAWILIGIPLLILLGVVNVVMPIIAIVSVVGDPDKEFRYPFILRLL